MSEAEDWDEERPELPVEIPFEHELAAIPLGAMQALQEEFLAGLYAAEDEGKVSHAEMVANAFKQLREFLLACHGEKWRRQKTSQCYEAIARASLADIGRKALVLMCNGSVPQDKAIALAITQIEAEDYTRAACRWGDTYGQGMEKFRTSKQAHEDHIKALEKMPKGKWQRDKTGDLPYMPFEEGLEALFPISSNYRGAKRKKVQRTRFQNLLIYFALGEHPKVLATEEERNRPDKERWEHLMKDSIKVGDPVPEKKDIEPLSHEERCNLLSKGEQKQIKGEVGKRLKEMERTGIPQELFRAAILWEPIRWEEYLHKERKKASDEGLEAQGKTPGKKNYQISKILLGALPGILAKHPLPKVRFWQRPPP